jgi:phage terminase large subunit-like protein
VKVEEQDIEAIAEAIETLEGMKQTNPELWYQPGKNGQEQAHRSTHPIRLLVPGNGWGKTMVAGIEASWWVKHSHPYRPTPPHPVMVLWVCNMLAQFKFMADGTLRPKCWGTAGCKVVHTNNGIPTEFVWPHGDTIKVFSSENPWEALQGIPVDLVIFDEQPPLPLYRELLRRRRTDRKTEFMIAATATKGASWMEQEIYAPWLEHHRSLGLDIDRAMVEQKHRRIFVWPRGSIADNPAADAEDVAEYAAQTWSSEAEKRVRDHGGFADFNGTPVFAQAPLEAMMQAARAVQQTKMSIMVAA